MIDDLCALSERLLEIVHAMGSILVQIGNAEGVDLLSEADALYREKIGE